MRLPVIRGTIDRRILINFRVAPAPLARVVPERFRPQIVKGFGIAGICLIRLKRIRPSYVPRWLGLCSENAAHRIAVEWDTGGTSHVGVYIARRDTASLWNTLAGGRFFPGVHHRARFRVAEGDGCYQVDVQSKDGNTRLNFDGRVTSTLPAQSIFGSLEEASDFFQSGSLGYSPSSKPGAYEGLELRTFDWRLEPLQVKRVASSYFDDRTLFPPGAVQFDCALLMRGIAHQWQSRESLCCSPGPTADASIPSCTAATRR